MAIRYISDLHFGHKNILRYDNRPWQNTEDMENAMVELWNKTVAYNDEVFILGDVVWSNHYEEWASILTGLNGVLYIVKGNHGDSRAARQGRDHQGMGSPEGDPGPHSRWEGLVQVALCGLEPLADAVLREYAP